MIREYKGIKIIKIIGNKVAGNTSIHHVDISVSMIQKLLQEGTITKNNIGVLLYVTETPMFMTPSSTFYLHKHLDINKDCFQYDVNQGGSGFVTGIQLAASLLLGFNDDKKAIVLFGDNELENEDGKKENIAAAVVLEKNTDESIFINNYSLGSKYELYMYADRKKSSFYTEKCLEELKGYYGKMMEEYENVDLSEIVLDDSSVRIPVRLIEGKKEGEVFISSAGAGISLAVMSCKLQAEIYS